MTRAKTPDLAQRLNRWKAVSQLPKPLGQVGPGGPGAGDPEDGVDEEAVVAGGGPGVGGLAGQEVLDAMELLVGHLEASHRCPP